MCTFLLAPPPNLRFDPHSLAALPWGLRNLVAVVRITATERGGGGAGGPGALCYFISCFTWQWMRLVQMHKHTLADALRRLLNGKSCLLRWNPHTAPSTCTRYISHDSVPCMTSSPVTELHKDTLIRRVIRRLTVRAKLPEWAPTPVSAAIMFFIFNGFIYILILL